MICVVPMSLPKPLPMTTAAGDLVLKDVAFVRHDRRHAGADALALDDRAMADAHAAHVRDRVERSGIEDTDRHAEIAQPRTLVVGCGCGAHVCNQGSKQGDGQHATRRSR